MQKLIITWLFLAAMCAAQNSTGKLTGVVVDSSGAAIASAKVTTGNSRVIRNVITDRDGHFVFPLLAPGAYSVKAERQGFRTADVKPIDVVSGKSTEIKIELRIGPEDTCCDYSSHAIDPTSSSVQSVHSDAQFQRLPVHDFTDVLNLP